MNLPLLRALIPIIVALFWMLSFFLFLRGHNEPGGGFIGALCFCLGVLALSFTSQTPRKLFDNSSRYIETTFMVGLGCFAVALVLPIFFGRASLQAVWSEVPFPVAGKLSTVLIFDFGVYLVVASSVVFIFKGLFLEISDD